MGSVWREREKAPSREKYLAAAPQLTMSIENSQRVTAAATTKGPGNTGLFPGILNRPEIAEQSRGGRSPRVRDGNPSINPSRAEQGGNFCCHHNPPSNPHSPIKWASQTPVVTSWVFRLIAHLCDESCELAVPCDDGNTQRGGRLEVMFLRRCKRCNHIEGNEPGGGL